MNRMNVKAVLFCCDGLYQRDLMWRLYDAFQLQAIVLQIDQSARTGLWQRLSRYGNPKALARYLEARLKRKSYDLKAKPVLESLFFKNGNVPTLPAAVPTIVVDNINSARAEEALDQFRPDIVCVNGTRLIRQPLLDR